jgi:hypothetical protein
VQIIIDLLNFELFFLPACFPASWPASFIAFQLIYFFLNFFLYAASTAAPAPTNNHVAVDGLKTYFFRRFFPKHPSHKLYRPGKSPARQVQTKALGLLLSRIISLTWNLTYDYLQRSLKLDRYSSGSKSKCNKNAKMRKENL